MTKRTKWLLEWREYKSRFYGVGEPMSLSEYINTAKQLKAVYATKPTLENWGECFALEVKMCL